MKHKKNTNHYHYNRLFLNDYYQQSSLHQTFLKKQRKELGGHIP